MFPDITSCPQARIKLYSLLHLVHTQAGADVHRLLESKSASSPGSAGDGQAGGGNQNKNTSDLEMMDLLFPHPDSGIRTTVWLVSGITHTFVIRIMQNRSLDTLSHTAWKAL